MKITRPPPSCSYFQTTEVPCQTCGRKMKLTLIEPSGPHIELRTYECAHCNSGDSFLIAI
jgi:DNA-directed RNA polymerase subunit RPC12/RpoP